jgi:hypothetical protein
MDVANFFVGSVGAAFAAIAAWFSWQEWSQRRRDELPLFTATAISQIEDGTWLVQVRHIRSVPRPLWDIQTIQVEGHPDATVAYGGSVTWNTGVPARVAEINYRLPGDGTLASSVFNFALRSKDPKLEIDRISLVMTLVRQDGTRRTARTKVEKS